MNGESKHTTGRELQLFQRQRRAQAVAQHAVADLIVVLGADHKLSRSVLARRTAVPAATVRGVFARERVTFAPDLGELRQAREILVVALPFPGEQHMQCVMKIIAPLRVHAVAAERARQDVPGHVHVALGDEIKRALQGFRLPMGDDRQLLQKRRGGKIADGVNRIQPQRVQVKFRLPVERVLGKKMADVIAFRPVIIQRPAPRRFVTIGEVRRELVHVISLRAEMVIDHVQHDGQTERRAPRSRGASGRPGRRRIPAPRTDIHRHNPSCGNRGTARPA